ncbi:hypothetical protein MKW92_028509 [Papaver armeniacum]|nr:hypothetical protein MKW92_028509 [Papaver armeniacum]
MHFLKKSPFQIWNRIRSRNFHCSNSRLFSNQQKQNSHIEDVGSSSMASHLKTRSVIGFRETGATLIYTAMLTPQGRFLYDLFIYRPSPSYEKPGSNPTDGPFDLLADVDANFVDELMDCFHKFRLRSNVDIEDMSEEFSCWQTFLRPLGWGAGIESIDKAGKSSTKGNSSGWQWYKDPRLDSLGFRGIFPSNTIPPLVEANKETDELNYLQWRVEKGVAEGSTEIPKGEAILLEYNLAGLNAISFNKGCYVGQESVARTHHRKRLLPLKFLNKSGNGDFFFFSLKSPFLLKKPIKPQKEVIFLSGISPPKIVGSQRMRRRRRPPRHQ